MKIIIFGTGISGRAIYRKLKKTHQIVGFIDNNPQLDGTQYDNINITLVEKIYDKDFDKIAIGGVWVDGMQQQLLDLKISQDKIWIIEDNTLDFSTYERVNITDNTVRELAKIMQENHISYCIEGSSLLCLLRNQDLSSVPDVDILIKCQNDLQTIWEAINTNPYLKQHKLTKVIYQKDKILTKKGEIDKIIIQSHANPTIFEPTVIDINLAVDIGQYYIMDYDNEHYLYFNKEYVDGENYHLYKDINLLIPFQAEEYVKLLYGENWKIPAKKWSYKDYGNLLTSVDLTNMIKDKSQ